MKDGKEIKTNERIKIVTEKKTHKLIIHNVTVEDRGEYKCVAGEVSTTAKLVVDRKYSPALIWTQRLVTNVLKI